MVNNLIAKYEREKTRSIKLIALCIKAVTGVLGASMILAEKSPYWTLAILCIGTLSNEIVNYITSGEKSKRIKFIAICIKSVTGVLGASMILTEQKPYVTLIILSLGAIANEILNFMNAEQQTPFPEDRNNPNPHQP